MPLIGTFSPVDGSMLLVSAYVEKGHTPSPIVAVLGVIGILAIVAVAACSRIGSIPRIRIPFKQSSGRTSEPRVGQAVFNRKVG